MKISKSGAEKIEWLEDWGYVLGTSEAEEAWINKCELDNGVRHLEAPVIFGNIEPYESPIDGRVISSRTQHREDLIRSGCVEYEPSMKQEMERKRISEDAALDKKVDAHVEETIYKMPARKREKLESELQSGVDIELTRR